MVSPERSPDSLSELLPQRWLTLRIKAVMTGAGECSIGSVLWGDSAQRGVFTPGDIDDAPSFRPRGSR